MTFIPKALPSTVDTVADLLTAKARTADGGLVQTAGYIAPGDDGGELYLYHRTGRSEITVDGGFYIAGSLADDYFEAKEKSVANIKKFGAVDGRTAAQNTAAIQAAVNASRRVFIPEGTDLQVNDEITVPDFTVIEGKGERSKITMAAATKNVFVAGEGNQFRGLTLIGPNSSDVSVSFGGCGIYVLDKSNVTIDSCVMSLWTWCGVYVQNSVNVTIKNNVMFSNRQDHVSCGDIVVWQTSNGGRLLIDGNMCLSNNSQGISLNGIGGSGKTIVVNNICSTLDPATCIEGGAWSAVAPASCARRHGIIVGYSNNVSDMLIANNICENTDWTGIYKPGPSDGPVVIANNICRKNGYDLISGQSIVGGILLRCSGGESVTGNSVFDFQKTTAGAITINNGSGSVNSLPVLVSGNTIGNSLGRGILLTTLATNVVVDGNMISGSASNDILIGPTAGNSSATAHTIINNVIYRTNTTTAAINFDQQASDQIVVISRNRLVGYDKTVNTAGNANCGIYRSANNTKCEITDNVISNFYHGIHHAAYLSGRITNYRIARNSFRNCTNGISASATTTAGIAFFEGNTFADIVTANYAGPLGYAIGMDAKLFGSNVHVYSATKPATRTWVKGDIAWNTAPGALGPMGWLCVADGTPGTWIALGTSDDGVQTVVDADAVLSVDRRKTVVYNAPLTADRLLTLPPDASASEGDAITIRRGGGGAFDLTVDALAVLDQDEWIKVKHDGNGYVVDSSSTPLTKVWSKVTTDPLLSVWLNGDANLDTTADANDKQANYNATWVGTPAYSTKATFGSASSQSFSLDGAASYLTLPSAAGNYTDNFAFSLWFNPTANQSGSLVNKRGTSTGYYLTLSGYLIYFYDSAGFHYIPATTYANGTWVHVAVSINGSNSAIYVNGVLKLTFTATISANAALLTIGRDAAAASGYFNGLISDVMIFSKALAPHEAKVLALGP